MKGGGGDFAILFVWLCGLEGSSQRIVAEVDNSIKTISLKLSRPPHSFILNRQITNQVINVQINQT